MIRQSDVPKLGPIALDRYLVPSSKQLKQLKSKCDASLSFSILTKLLISLKGNLHFGNLHMKTLSKCITN